MGHPRIRGSISSLRDKLPETTKHRGAHDLTLRLRILGEVAGVMWTKEQAQKIVIAAGRLADEAVERAAAGEEGHVNVLTTARAIIESLKSVINTV
jgi:hypothetical protein